MSSSIVAVSSDSDSALGSSGLNAGSLASEASALCSSAVTVPEAARAPSGTPPGRCAIWSSASSQPPTASGKKRCATPSVAENERPSYSYQPCSGAMLAELLPGQELQQLELRVDPRLQPAKHLEHRLVAEHDRRVGLLDAHRRGPAPRAQRPGCSARGGSESARPRCPARARRRSGAAGSRASSGSATASTAAHSGAAGRPRDRRPRRSGRKSAAAGRARGCRWQSAPARASSSSGGASASDRDSSISRPVTCRDLDAYQRCCSSQSPTPSRSRLPRQRRPGSARARSSDRLLALLAPAGTSRSRAARASAGRTGRRSAGSGCGRTARPDSRPAWALRSSSTAWAERARLCTHSTRSSSKRRMHGEDPRVGGLRSARRCRSRTPGAPCAAR